MWSKACSGCGCLRIVGCRRLEGCVGGRRLVGCVYMSKACSVRGPSHTILTLILDLLLYNYVFILITSR